MALTDEEARQIYEALARSVRDAGLEWIVEQVEEQLALGSVDIKSLPINERNLFLEEGEIFTAAPQSRKRSKGTFAVSRPYSLRERLSLLIESLLIGVVQINQIEGEVAKFSVSDLKSTTIEFSPEAEVKSAFRLETSEHSFRREKSERLAKLLQELRNEI